MILLWGLAEDRPLMAVCEALVAQGSPVAFLDQRDVLVTAVDLTVDTALSGTLQVHEEVLDLSEVTAAYLRPYDTRRLPEVQAAGPESAAWRHALAVEDLMLSWAELTSAFVVNRPAAMAANGAKPYQLLQLRAAGFCVPETLVTTDPLAVESFWEQHGAIIYKSVSGLQSKVSRLHEQHRERLADVAFCPTQFQQYIPGTDYRVHVIGKEVFACTVRAEADDYRYVGADSPPPEIRACRLPEEVEERCRTMSAAMSLYVSGIDLRCTPEGTWYCFEVNPAPAYTYYQAAAGQPLSAAIARLLTSAG
jgi:glutathione synthase/RimK-type ligase-like ATP-grasp enzyme